MDRRSFCKVLGFAAGSTLLPGLMVQAAGQGSMGHAVPDGRYTIGIRSDLSGCDLTHAFYYSDSFFTHPATQYDHQLALATLGLVCAAANTVASDAEYWVNGSVGREAHIAAAYETLGFEDALFYNYDLDTGRAGDFVGYSLARKTLTLNGQRTTLVALVLRGGGYGGEWASNFHIGDTSAHTGFVTPVAAVFASLKAYLARAGQGGAFKLWLGGYSRGSIIANLLAAKIARELPQLGRENIYAYGFAVPAALTAADRPDLQQDFDANHAPDGTLLENWPESNIFSIISSITNLGNSVRLKQSGLKTVFFLVLNTFIASLITLIAGVATNIGGGVQYELATDYTAKEVPTFVDTVISLFPQNLAAHRSNGEVLPRVEFSILLAVS